MTDQTADSPTPPHAPWCLYIRHGWSCTCGGRPAVSPPPAVERRGDPYSGIGCSVLGCTHDDERAAADYMDASSPAPATPPVDTEQEQQAEEVTDGMVQAAAVAYVMAGGFDAGGNRLGVEGEPMRAAIRAALSSSPARVEATAPDDGEREDAHERAARRFLARHYRVMASAENVGDWQAYIRVCAQDQDEGTAWLDRAAVDELRTALSSSPSPGPDPSVRALVEQIGELREKATAGPWEAEETRYGDDVMRGGTRTCLAAGASPPNAALIVALVNAWPQIADALGGDQ